MSDKVELLLRQSCIDVRHIEKYADEEFEDRLKEYTKMVILDVAKVLSAADTISVDAEDEILSIIEEHYGVSIDE